MSSGQILAIDPSLTCSGWALIDIAHGQLFAAGTIRPPDSSQPLQFRLRCLQESVVQLLGKLTLDSDDYLVCEGPAPLVKNPQSALKVEQVRSVFESVARARGMCVPGRVNPRTVHTEVLALRGKQIERSLVKATARMTAERMFGAEIINRLAKPRNPGVGSNSKSKTAGSARHKRGQAVSQDIIDALLIAVVARSRIQRIAQVGAEGYLLFEENKARSRRGSLQATGWYTHDVARILARNE